MTPKDTTPLDYHEGTTMQLAKADPAKTRVGWIGTGVMGRGCAST